MIVSNWKVTTLEAIQIEEILSPKKSFTAFVIPELTLDKMSISRIMFSTRYAPCIFPELGMAEKQNGNQ
jgi:hypothetical protein